MNYRAAATTALLNNLRNIKLQNCALGAKPETLNLVVRDTAGRSLGGASKIVDHCGDDTVKIETATIDNALQSARARLSILHLDLEGFEEPAILGAAKTIERHRPIIIVETLPSPVHNAGKFLRSLGYRATQALDANTVLAP